MASIVVRLMGGLGNQMFQYATGAALAHRHGLPLLLDRGFLDHRPAGMSWTPREFELDRLQAPIAFAPDALVRKLRRPWELRGHRFLHGLLPWLFPVHCVKEQGTGYDPRLVRMAPPVYLEGFWQNEGYFLDIADRLRSDWYLPHGEPDARNRQLLELIASGSCASLHVRRGDYVSNSETAAFHGACDASYYHRAAQWLIERHDIRRFIVFSDEPEWAQANLQLPCPAEHVSHNTGQASHWDMHLMRHCTHHIIANSSFSWWGAWLNPSPAKTVIGPKQWFQGTSTPATDILPAAWTAL